MATSDKNYHVVQRQTRVRKIVSKISDKDTMEMKRRLAMKGEKSSANSGMSVLSTRQPEQSAALHVQVDELTVTELKVAKRWWIAYA